MPETKGAGKVRISLGGGIKKLFWGGVIVFIVVNPLGAAMFVHDTAHWIGSWFS